MRVLHAFLPTALLVLAACGGGPAPRAHAVDTECLQGLPFATAVSGLHDRYAPQFSALSDRLGAARSASDSQALLTLVAQLLAQEESDLNAVRTPADDSELVQGQLAADETMRVAAETMAGASPSAMASARQSFVSAAQARQQAERALQLRAEFLKGECG